MMNLSDGLSDRRRVAWSVHDVRAHYGVPDSIVGPLARISGPVIPNPSEKDSRQYPTGVQFMPDPHLPHPATR